MHRRLWPLLGALVAPFVLAQAPAGAASTGVSLETLVRASENRLGIYAFHPASGAKLAFNADVAYPGGALARLPAAAVAVGSADGAASRPADPAAEVEALRPIRGASDAATSAAAVSPRAVADAVRALRRTVEGSPDGPLSRAFGDAAREPFGGALSPFLETGHFASGLADRPGVAGYVATPRGEVLVCVLTDGFRSGSSAEALLPAVVAACVTRLVGGLVEEAAVTPPGRGSFTASLHEARRDAELFGRADLGDGRAIAAERAGREAPGFKLGETARLAVVGFPDRRARIAVEWRLPGRADDRVTAQSWIDARAVSDRLFDLPLNEAGRYGVRVVIDGAPLFSREFFVTKP